MLASGHTHRPLDDKKQEELRKDFEVHNYDMHRLSPGNWLFPESFIPYLDKIYSFKFRPSDVFIVTFPKCGTTWMQEIVWTILNNPNLDNPKAKLGINNRCVFLEMDAIFNMTGEVLAPDGTLMMTFNKLCPGKDPKDGIFMELADAGPDPRTIKSHLPLSLFHPSLLDKCKVVYVARNPKDVCVSYLHHSRLIKAHSYVGTQDKFIDYFVHDDTPCSPYSLHVKEAWEKRDHKNLHFVFYEDLKADPVKGVEDLVKFLGVKLTTKQVQNVVDYTGFSAMKSRGNILDDKESNFMSETVIKNEGGFFRKGQPGSWKEKLTPEQNEKIEKWAKENAPEIPFRYS